MISIPLTKGYFALIDDEDAHLSEVRWCAHVKKHGAIYARRYIRHEDGKQRGLALHREVLGLKTGDGSIVDHINGNGLDCRKTNLRLVTNQENGMNRAGAQAGSSSGFLGVTRHGSGWRATIMANGKTKCLGTFATPKEANVARLKAEKELWGIHPRRRAAFEDAGLPTKGTT